MVFKARLRIEKHTLKIDRTISPKILAVIEVELEIPT